jgi:hypothetical protein
MLAAGTAGGVIRGRRGLRGAGVDRALRQLVTDHQTPAGRGGAPLRGRSSRRTTKRTPAPSPGAGLTRSAQAPGALTVQHVRHALHDAGHVQLFRGATAGEVVQRPRQREGFPALWQASAPARATARAGIAAAEPLQAARRKAGHLGPGRSESIDWPEDEAHTKRAAAIACSCCALTRTR